MTNRQWLTWQLIDMTDEEFRRTLNYKYCADKINGKCPHGCKADCLERMLAWLQLEHKERGEDEK
jgi:hypothetical protein